MNHLDLFSGIGGFALAANWAGFKTEAFCEIDPFCVAVLNKNFNNPIIFNDIKSLKITKKFDLMTAGFPCQPYSQAGKKKGRQDKRHLWPECRRIINESRPRSIVLDNVSNLIKMEFDNIIADLEKEGYQTESFILPACAANAPHRRDRLWIVAYDNSIRSHCRFDSRTARQIYTDEKWYASKIQQEWSQLIPDIWETFTAKDWLSYNSKLSRRNNGISGKLDKNRVKALGNSIVPQVVFPILKYLYFLLGDS